MVFASVYSNQTASVYKKMLEINRYWLYHQEDCPNDVISYENDLEAIEIHLTLVCKSLKANTPNGLSESQRKKRSNLISELEQYAELKKFPTNLYHSTRTPYFVDDFGVHCAVGFLISASGHGELVQAIRENENYSYIEDIKTPGIMAWAMNHGFSLDELKWIQPGYMPATEIQTVGQGANGTVKKMLTDNSGALIIAGDFDTLDVFSCLKIGKFHNEQFSCLGAGLNGIINDISISSLGIVAYGQFLYNNQNYSIAIFKDDVWSYLNIPSREGAMAISGFTNNWSSFIRVAINFSQDDNLQEVWVRSSLSGPWWRELSMNGPIYTMGASGLYQVYAGHFDQVVVYDNLGEVASMHDTKNAIIKVSDSWTAITDSSMPDTVFCSATFSNQIYFGGFASSDENSSGVMLSRFLNNEIQPVILSTNFSLPQNGNSIRAILHESSSGSFLLAGDFFGWQSGLVGKNFLRYFPSSHVMQNLGLLDKNAYSVASMGGQIYVGGDFQTNRENAPVNRLGRITFQLDVEENLMSDDIVVFPNPCTNILQIAKISGEYNCQVVNLNGQVLIESTTPIDNKLNLSNLENGIYLLKITKGNYSTSRKIIKE